jgi:hypothetical protein
MKLHYWYASCFFVLPAAINACMCVHTCTHMHISLFISCEVSGTCKPKFICYWLIASLNIFYIDFAIFHLVLPSNIFFLIIKQLKADTTQHFILIDGTWSNSAAMFRRLQVTSG